MMSYPPKDRLTCIPLDTRQFMTILELGNTDEGYVID